MTPDPSFYDANYFSLAGEISFSSSCLARLTSLRDKILGNASHRMAVQLAADLARKMYTTETNAIEGSTYTIKPLLRSKKGNYLEQSRSITTQLAMKMPSILLKDSVWQTSPQLNHLFVRCMRL